MANTRGPCPIRLQLGAVSGDGDVEVFGDGVESAAIGRRHADPNLLLGGVGQHQCSRSLRVVLLEGGAHYLSEVILGPDAGILSDLKSNTPQLELMTRFQVDDGDLEIATATFIAATFRRNP